MQARRSSARSHQVGDRVGSPCPTALGQPRTPGRRSGRRTGAQVASQLAPLGQALEGEGAQGVQQPVPGDVSPPARRPASELRTRASSPSRVASSSSSPATARAVSAVKEPASTPEAVEVGPGRSSSSCTYDHSIVARRVRWRSVPRKWGRASVSRSLEAGRGSPRGSVPRVRAAAISRARGTPSSARHRAATDACWSSPAARCPRLGPGPGRAGRESADAVVQRAEGDEALAGQVRAGSGWWPR